MWVCSLLSFMGEVNAQESTEKMKDKIIKNTKRNIIPY